MALAFSPDGKALATTSDDGSVSIWDIPTDEPARALKRPFRLRPRPRVQPRRRAPCTPARATAARSSGTFAADAGSGGPFRFDPVPRPAKGRTPQPTTRRRPSPSAPTTRSSRRRPRPATSRSGGRPIRQSSLSCMGRLATSSRSPSATTAAFSPQRGTRRTRSSGTSPRGRPSRSSARRSAPAPPASPSRRTTGYSRPPASAHRPIRPSCASTSFPRAS